MTSAEQVCCEFRRRLRGSQLLLLSEMAKAVGLWVVRTASAYALFCILGFRELLKTAYTLGLVLHMDKIQGRVDVNCRVTLHLLGRVISPMLFLPPSSKNPRQSSIRPPAVRHIGVSGIFPAGVHSLVAPIF